MTYPTRLVLVIVAALAATFAVPFGPHANAGEASRIVIEIKALAFAPTLPVVRAGDTVVWRNLDIVPHTATATDGSWDSGEIEAGGEWETVITEKMSMDYFCAFHPSMVAALDVRSRQHASSE
jgi:plastocyanin